MKRIEIRPCWVFSNEAGEEVDHRLFDAAARRARDRQADGGSPARRPVLSARLEHHRALVGVLRQPAGPAAAGPRRAPLAAG